MMDYVDIGTRSATQGRVGKVIVHMQKGNRMKLKDADKIKEAIQNSDDFVGGSDDIIKVIDSVPEAIEALCAVCGKACDKSEFVYNAPQDEQVILCPEHYCLCTLPSAQSETAKRIVGKSRGGMTLWYQCDMCNEPVDVQDNFCRGCGRRLIDE